MSINRQSSQNKPYRYILFHKPCGVLCRFTDAGDGPGARHTLKDYIPVPDVYPVGRLDSDSEGLLLLTDNGGLQHRLSHPKFHHPKTYLVQVERVPGEDALEKLRNGVTIQDYRTRPAIVELLPEAPDMPPRNPPVRYRKNVPDCWLKITITEGKNRQVRRMTAAVGFPTLRLVRISIGIGEGVKLELGSLAPGEWRDATEGERRALETAAGKRR
jgi:23S rRNA pseudouridine2457 synthase